MIVWILKRINKILIKQIPLQPRKEKALLFTYFQQINSKVFDKKKLFKKNNTKNISSNNGILIILVFVG